MHPYHPHFPVLSGLQPLCDLSSPLKKENEEEKHKSDLYCLYTHWSVVKLPVASSLKKAEFFPTLGSDRSR